VLSNRLRELKACYSNSAPSIDQWRSVSSSLAFNPKSTLAKQQSFPRHALIRFPDRHHGTRRLPHHGLGHAAGQKMTEARATVRFHHDGLGSSGTTATRRLTSSGLGCGGSSIDSPPDNPPTPKHA
jgi:hypothetical protein